MIVCLCKQVSCSDIRNSVDRGASTTESLKRELGVGTGCGRCLDEVERVSSARSQENQAVLSATITVESGVSLTR